MSKNNNSNNGSTNQAIIEYIYSTAFTTRFVEWLFTSRRSTAPTFARKYRDAVARHEDVTEFIISKKVSLLMEEEPALFELDIWADETMLFSGLRARFFTIYLNFTINRWKRYKRTQSRELQIFTAENSIEETMTNEANPDIISALIYKQAWNQYTATLDSTDRTIALFLLKGTITMSALEKAVGLKKSQIYVKLQKIESDIQTIISELKGV